jgi:hypothetical protein
MISADRIDVISADRIDVISADGIDVISIATAPMLRSALAART